MMPNEMQEILAKILFFVCAVLMLTFAKVQATGVESFGQFELTERVIREM